MKRHPHLWPTTGKRHSVLAPTLAVVCTAPRPAWATAPVMRFLRPLIGSQRLGTALPRQICQFAAAAASLEDALFPLRQSRSLQLPAQHGVEFAARSNQT